jgi:hypothetical protein
MRQEEDRGLAIHRDFEILARDPPDDIAARLRPGYGSSCQAAGDAVVPSQ